MPLYDYQCQDCQTIFEVRATFQEKEAGLQPECPHCQGQRTHQLLRSGPFLRKGGDGVSAYFVGGPHGGSSCCGSSCGCKG